MGSVAHDEELLKRLTDPLGPTTREREVLDILNKYDAGSKVAKAGGGQLVVREGWPSDDITVKTVLQDTDQGEDARKAMEGIAETFEKHGMSCTVETDFNRCNCPQQVILTCKPPHAR